MARLGEVLRWISLGGQAATSLAAYRQQEVQDRQEIRGRPAGRGPLPQPPRPAGASCCLKRMGRRSGFGTG